MSIRELPAYAKRAIIRNAAENHAELDGLFYLTDLLAACAGNAYDGNYRYRELVHAIRSREQLMPGSRDIPGGYESRAEADIAVENWGETIEDWLLLLVPDDGIPAAKVTYNPSTGEWVAEIRIAS